MLTRKLPSRCVFQEKLKKTPRVAIFKVKKLGEANDKAGLKWNLRLETLV